jgi:hypothetical protein
MVALGGTGYAAVILAPNSVLVGVTLNAVNRSGATIFTNSSVAGGFFSYGTSMVTAS